MLQMRPTTDTAARVRAILAEAGIRANVARQRYATRVVVFSWTDRMIAVLALSSAGFSGPAGQPFAVNSSFIAPDADIGRFELNAYEVR